VKLRTALAIALAFAGCKSETARKADRAAKDVLEQRADLKEAATQDPARAVAESKELSAAARLFIERRRVRVAALRGEHSVIASQLRLISTFAEHAKITDAGRADINNKLSAFRMRLDEAANHIEGLRNAGADIWQQRDDAVQDAMDSLDNARRAAWRALDDAPRIHRNAS
jgi:hypothetical protein